MHVSYPIVKKRRELCRLRLPLAVCEAYLVGLMDTAHHLEVELRPIALQLAAATTSGLSDDPYPLSAATPTEGRLLEFMAAEALEKGLGFVWCSQCGREFEAAGTIFERYQRGRGALEGSEGRRFYCGSSAHLLLAVVDLRA